MGDRFPGVALLGEGELASAIATRLNEGTGARLLGETQVDDAFAAVVVADGMLAKPLPRRVPLIPVSTEPAQVLIGPLIVPGVASCWTCADLRRRRNDPFWEAVVTRNRTALTSRPSARLTSFATDTVAAIVGGDILALREGTPPRTASAQVRCSLEDLLVSTHRLLPEPLCPDCGNLPDDTADLARVSMTRRPKAHPAAFRLRAVADGHEELLAAFVDAEVGLIGKVETGDEGGLPVAKASVSIRGSGATEAGWGRTMSYRSSMVTAVLEAVERWGGLQAGGRRTTVRSSYGKLRDLAVDPRILGLHSPEQYAQPGFPFTPFHEDLDMSWVWAYSFGRGEPILVPESYAYYGAHLLRPDEPRLAYEVSNGCALGSCLEEAILHGLFEVAERDAFLMAWYARRPLPRVDLATASDPRIRLLAAHLQEANDRTVTILETTLEHGVPAVWAIAVDRSGDGDRAWAMSTGGAHLDPERAVYSALCELGPILASVERSYRYERARVTAMAGDSTLVRTMGDHLLVYADPTVSHRLDFLFASPESRSLRQMAERGAQISPNDLTRDVERSVGRFLSAGLDVVVVNQTTPEHVSAGFACVKVIVPGTLPMTFGHGMRRVEGLPRLFSVPRSLGDPDPPAQLSKLNPHPHPFP